MDLHRENQKSGESVKGIRPSVEEASRIYENLSKELNTNPSYHDDDGLRYFVSSAHSNFTLMKQLEETNPEAVKAFEDLLIKQELFNLRRNLMDDKISGPQVVDSISDQFDIVRGFDGFHDRKIISLGMQPAGMDYKEEQYSWNNGTDLNIEVINIPEGGYFEYVFNQKDLRLDEKAVILCADMNADAYLAYLLLTGQINPNDEQAKLIIKAIKEGLNMDESDLSELKNNLGSDDLQKLSVFLTAKKKSKEVITPSNTDESRKVKEVLDGYPGDKDADLLFSALPEIKTGIKERVIFLAQALRKRPFRDFSPAMINKMIHCNKGIIERIVADILLNGAPEDLIDKTFTYLLIKGSGDEALKWKIGNYLADNVPKTEEGQKAVMKYCGKAFGRQHQNQWDLAFNIAKEGNYPELNERLKDVLFEKKDDRFTYLKIFIINNAEKILGENWRKVLKKFLAEDIPQILKEIVTEKLSPTDQDTDKIEIDLKSREERIKGALFGFAIGDAIGAPIEILTKKQIDDRFGKVTDFVEHEYQTLPSGEHTDDTETTLMLMEDIMEQGNFNLQTYIEKLKTIPEDLFNNKGYDRHYGHGALNAMKRLSMRQDYRFSGNDSHANGAAIRVIPLAVLDLFDPKKGLAENVHDCSLITHNNKEAIEGAYLTALATEYCLQTDDFNSEELLKLLESHVKEPVFKQKIRLVRELLAKGVSYEEAEEIMGSSSKIIKTLPYALFCFLKDPDDFKEIIINSINLEGDSDSIAAIAGGFYGALHGYSSLPKEWIEKVKCKDRIEALFK